MLLLLRTALSLQDLCIDCWSRSGSRVYFNLDINPHTEIPLRGPDYHSDRQEMNRNVYVFGQKESACNLRTIPYPRCYAVHASILCLT